MDSIISERDKSKVLNMVKNVQYRFKLDLILKTLLLILEKDEIDFNGQFITLIKHLNGVSVGDLTLFLTDYRFIEDKIKAYHDTIIFKQIRFLEKHVFLKEFNETAVSHYTDTIFPVLKTYWQKMVEELMESRILGLESEFYYQEFSNISNSFSCKQNSNENLNAILYSNKDLEDPTIHALKSAKALLKGSDVALNLDDNEAEENTEEKQDMKSKSAAVNENVMLSAEKTKHKQSTKIFNDIEKVDLNRVPDSSESGYHTSTNSPQKQDFEKLLCPYRELIKQMACLQDITMRIVYKILLETIGIYYKDGKVTRFANSKTTIFPITCEDLVTAEIEFILFDIWRELHENKKVSLSPIIKRKQSISNSQMHDKDLPVLEAVNSKIDESPSENKDSFYIGSLDKREIDHIVNITKILSAEFVEKFTTKIETPLGADEKCQDNVDNDISLHKIQKVTINNVEYINVPVIMGKIPIVPNHPEAAKCSGPSLDNSEKIEINKDKS